MKYLADVLTLFRLIAAFAVAYLIITEMWSAALVVFLVASLSDALDGLCARRWPYSPADEARLPWRRIDPHAIDNIPDALMVALAVIALTLSFDYWIWLFVLIYGVSAIFMVSIRTLLRRGVVRSAEIVDVMFGWWFFGSIVMIVYELAYRADFVALVLVASVIALPVLMYYKRDRAFARPETRELAEKYRNQANEA